MMNVRVTNRPGLERTNSHYVSNRPPLRTNPLVKLPLGSVRARGWIRHQLELMANGLTGRLQELSAFLKPGNGWFDPAGDGWEEQPYWLRGFHDLGVLLDNQRIMSEAEGWIDAVVRSQDAEGYFGARLNKSVVGKNQARTTDIWPHMVMLDALITHYEHTNDSRIIPLMTKFFRWCERIPDDQFMPRKVFDRDFGDWRPQIQQVRAGDMLPHLYWLFNRTGDQKLLDLATRFHRSVQPPLKDWLEYHVVHFTQRFREPGTYYVQSNDPKDLAETEYWYDMHMATWGLPPGGIFAADEILRPGKTDPRQACETCAMVEFNKSFYILAQITGQSLYADRVEDIMFNSFPASHTPDLKALHYLTAGNQPQLDASEHHDYHNKGRMIDYSPHMYRCCQHNSAMGWPYYVEHLWMATSDNGLAAWMYGACDVTAKVGTGQIVAIREDTDYPFSDRVSLTIETHAPAEFPLYLRVPMWCHRFEVAINGKSLAISAQPEQYVVIERSWSDGDRVDIVLPAELSIRQWTKSANSVTVDRGPLSYSVKIEERWQKCGGTDEWPEWEVFPTTPWNYGLVVDPVQPDKTISVARQRQVTDQPWTVQDAPIELKAKAKKLPEWKLINETVDVLPKSPAHSNEPEETITLIPMGCARLRMSCLPTIAEEPDTR